VARLVANELQTAPTRTRTPATSTGKVPTPSATAASSGSDINGMAARAAARTLRERLVAFAAEKYGVPATDVTFLPNRVRIGAEEVPFVDLVKQAWFGRVSLSATGYYRPPKIHY